MFIHYIIKPVIRIVADINCFYESLNIATY